MFQILCKLIILHMLGSNLHKFLDCLLVLQVDMTKFDIEFKTQV